MRRAFGLAPRLAAEGLGSAGLAAVVVGSGIMAERLCGGNAGLSLLANSLATAGGLYALILAFGPVSGGHFNPAVSLGFAMTGRLRPGHAASYAAAQILGALSGIALTHAMFALPLIQVPVQASAHARAGLPLLLSETFGTALLLFTILATEASAPEKTPAAVAALVGAGTWFTGSTFFTNPALTLARAFTDTFAGIRLRDVPAFVAVQVLGALLAVAAYRLLHRHGVQPPAAPSPSNLD